MRFLLAILVSVFCFQGCSCGSGSRHGTLRIGIDPTWSPLNFGAQQPYVSGFAEEMLLEIARYNGIAFERIPANWDSLLEGMKEEKYDAVLSSLPPYDYNTANYDFSQSFLETGSVLVVPVGSKSEKLADMKGDLVGLVAGDSATAIVRSDPGLVLRYFDSAPSLLNALAAGEINAAVLDRVPAVNYIRDLYTGVLKITGAPLNDMGLRLIAPKGKNDHLVAAFNKSLEHLKKKKKLEALQKKWGLEG